MSNRVCGRVHRFVLVAVILGVGMLLAQQGVPIAHAASRTWTGGGADNNWTTAANWGGVAPVAGDSLVFPAGAARLSNVNNFPDGTVFASITISGSGYTLGGNRVSLTTELEATYNGGTSTVNLVISGAGNVVVSGSGRLVLAGANTYTGQTRVENGALRARHGSALGAASGGTVVFDAAGLDGALEFEGTFTSAEPISLDYSGHELLRLISGAVTLTGDVYISTPAAGIAVLSGTLTLNGDVVNGGLFKTGDGTLVLNGDADDYLDILEGRLVLNGVAAGRVELAEDAQLRGRGVAGTIYSYGGVVYPGPGTLDSMGVLVLDSDSIFAVDIEGTAAGTGYGQLITGGRPTLGSATLSIDVDLPGLPDVGTVFTLIKNNSGDAVSGTFKNVPEGHTFTRDHMVFKVSYKGGDGNDVTLTITALELADLSVTATAAPEPAAPGSLLTYSITVANAGPFAARDVQFIMPVPEGVTYVSHVAPPGWSCTVPAVGSTGQLRCERSQLDAGASHVFTLVVKIDASRTTSLAPKAVVLSSTPDFITHDNADTWTTHISGVASQYPYKRVVPMVARD